MTVQPLVVIGASNALREIAGIVHAINQLNPSFEIIGALDDSEEIQDKRINNVPVLGTIASASSLDSDVRFVFGIGSIKTQLIRDRILENSGVLRDRFPALIHPKADIDPTASVGNGCIVHPGACLGPGSSLDDFAVIAVNSALGPDARVNEFAMITSLVLVLSRATIGRMSFVGSMSCVLEDVNVGDGARIGVGSVVAKDVPSGAVAIGSPARLIGKNQNSI
jgi:sugar O-acyltransferase (sialic acid O-acetyltransferase NeuD family)